MSGEFFIFVLLLVTSKIDPAKTELSVNSSATYHKGLINKCCAICQHVGRRKQCESFSATRGLSWIPVYNDNMRYIPNNFNDLLTIVPGKFEDRQFKYTAIDVNVFNFNLYVMHTGDLKMEMPNSYERWMSIARHNYCVDFLKVPYQKTSLRFWVVLPESEIIDEVPIVFTYALFVSCCFLLLVLLVYTLVPGLQTLSGKIVAAYVLSLFTAFLLSAYMQLSANGPLGCICLTMGIYHFFVATFCWMNVMAFDIWWNFRGLTKARPICCHTDRFKTVMYCLYAWGVPLCMTICLAVLNQIDLRNVPWLVTPNVPEHGCFLEGGVKFLYLYIPMLMLNSFNCLFYLLTAVNMNSLSGGTAIFSDIADKRETYINHKNRFLVHLKLSALMAISFVLEIVSFLYPRLNVWYITDTYNVLIGFMVFLILVCKKEIFMMIFKRHGNKIPLRSCQSDNSCQNCADTNNESATEKLKEPTHDTELP